MGVQLRFAVRVESLLRPDDASSIASSGGLVEGFAHVREVRKSPFGARIGGR